MSPNGQHRQDRTEDLVVHHRGVGLDPGEHGGREVALGPIAGPTDHGGVVAAGVEQLHQAVVVALVDDAGVVVRPVGIGAVHGGDRVGERGDNSSSTASSTST
jgi:hypothetical protein